MAYEVLDYLDWGLHSLEAGVLNDPVPQLVMPSPVSTDLSTGYLEDAVAEWVHRCKQRWTTPEDQTPENVVELCNGFWNSNCHGDPFDTDLNSCFTKDTITNPGESSNPSSSSKATSTVEEAMTENQLFCSSSSSHKDLNRKDCTSEPREFSQSSDQHSNIRHLSIKEKEGGGLKKKKKVTMRVAYPFAVVKPGGIEGEVKLDDINKRMLMRPMRPVRHPVGEFACVPCVSSAGRPGLSGKAVVSLTKIHTQGRGTITIIRTRG